MKKNFFTVALLAIVSLCYSLNAQADDREFIRKVIADEGECRNVAITQRNGNVALFGKNGWATSDNTPKGLSDELDKLTNDNEYIDDVQLTERGNWLILYGDNGLIYEGVPASLDDMLKEYHRANEVINSVTFNDKGDWIVISNGHCNASSKRIENMIDDGAREYGEILAACVTDDAIVLVFKDGYVGEGNVPDSLDRELKKTDVDYYRVKVAGDTWFISDGKADYVYDM